MRLAERLIHLGKADLAVSIAASVTAALALGTGFAAWAAEPPGPARPVTARTRPAATSAPKKIARAETQFAGVTVSGDEVILAPNGQKVTVVGSAMVRAGSTTISSDRLMVIKSSDGPAGDLVIGDQVISSPNSKIVTVVGNASYRHADVTVSGDRLVITRADRE